MDTVTSRRGFVGAAAGAAAGVAAAAMAGGSAKAAETGAATAPKVNDFFAGKGNARQITDDIWWVGAADKRLALFENVYPLEQGMTYNSYVILDDKVALIDTIDRAVTGQWLENLNAVLDGRQIDYLVVDHMEPDHSAGIDLILNKFPQCTIVTSAKAKELIDQFFEIDATDRTKIVAEGDVLELGTHSLAFVEAPMVHWPEVLMCYDAASGVLFSADAFGSFNSLDGNIFADQVDYDNDWMPEARRFVVNIVGKYGPQIQAALDKAATLDIKYICSTHGLVWRKDIDKILDKYTHWANYEPEDQAVVIYYGSIYGGTENAANILATMLSQDGVENVKVYDVSKTHKSWLLAEAFRASHLVFASPTYNMGIYTPMKELLNYLVEHNMQNRHVAFIENGSWQPVAAKLMRNIVAQMSNMTLVGSDITLLSTTNEANLAELQDLADALAASVAGDDSSAVLKTLESDPKVVNASAGDVMHTNPDTAAVAAGTVPQTAATKQWKCSVCGYVFEGESLPDDFVCPLCGASADKFVPVA